jgi:hypothetical protein
LRNEIPRVGTPYIPSIENRAGCKKVGGIWDLHNDVCLMYDNEWNDFVGFTAPVKGSFSWWRVDEAPVDNGPGVYKGTVGMNLVANSRDYPLKIDTTLSFIKDPVEGRFENAQEFYDLLRLNGVTFSRQLLKGVDDEWQYYTPEGKKTEPNRFNAIGVNSDADGHYVKISYSDVKKQKIAPFKIRNVRDVPMRPNFTIDHPWMKYK